MLSGYKNTYIVTIFDFCREELPKDEIRGGGEQEAEVKRQNFYVTFGCPPSQGVPAKSTIVENNIYCINQYLNENGGILVLLTALEYFKSDYETNSSERKDTT